MFLFHFILCPFLQSHFSRSIQDTVHNKDNSEYIVSVFVFSINLIHYFPHTPLNDLHKYRQYGWDIISHSFLRFNDEQHFSS